MMSIVTAVTFILAFRYESFAVSLLGWAGGFLTPIMLSTGQANELGLFTYLAMLEAGIIAVLIKRQRWLFLEPLTLIAMYAMYFSWYTTYYTPTDFLITVLFLGIFWGLFFVLDVYRSLEASSFYSEIRVFLGALNALIFFSLLHEIVEKNHDEWSGAVIALIGTFYFGGHLIIRARRADVKFVTMRFIVTAIIFLVIATSIQFESSSIISGWSIEAGLLILAGLRYQRKEVHISGLFLLGLSFLTLLGLDNSLTTQDIKTYTFFFSERALAYVLLTTAFCLAAVFQRRTEWKNTRLLTSLFHYAWMFVFFLFLSSETVDLTAWISHNASGPDHFLVEYHGLLILLFVWAAYSLVLMGAGLHTKVQSFYHAALTILAITLLTGLAQGIEFWPVQRFTPLFNMRVLVLVLLIASTFFESRILKHDVASASWNKHAIGIMHIAAVVMILVLLTGEIRDFFRKDMFHLMYAPEVATTQGELQRLHNMQQLALSGVWLLYSIVLMTFGILKQKRAMRIVAFVLFGISILKIFIYDLSSLETLYRIFSFIALGLILLVVSYLFQRFKDLLFGNKRPLEADGKRRNIAKSTPFQ